MIPRLILAGLVAALFLPAAAPAGQPEACAARRAVPATVEQIMSDGAWKGRCVSVTAMADGYRLYSGVEGFYRSARADGADPAQDPDARGRLGLDNGDLMRRIPRGRFSEATVVGRVQDCEEMRATVNASLGPDEIGWVSGYCHTETGPVLRLAEVGRVSPMAPLRRMGEAARSDYGNLVFAPGSWTQRAEAAAQADAYLAALRRGDRAAFVALHDDEGGSASSSAAAALAFAPDSPFAEIRRSARVPQIAIFLHRHDIEALGEAGASAPSATVCFCRSADCTGKWPISEHDADNAPERPYVCTGVQPLQSADGMRWIFRTHAEPPGLTEPAETAFRR
ncbi:MAG TPA: hypothetical protein VGB79_02235 [Allosphingosinicella sp.]|jgi:hypothetical protein